MTYSLINNKEEFEKAMPFTGEAAFNEFVNVYPRVYPCIMKFQDNSSNECGYSFHIEFIYDMSDFIYRDAKLYKKEQANFIVEKGILYRECS